jgi:cell wall assembly regulator SMI1
MKNLDDLWNRFEIQLRSHAPQLEVNLRSGATQEQLTAFEAEIGQSLPEDVRHAYLRHNGTKIVGHANNWGIGLFGSQQWLCLDHVLQNWQESCQQDDEEIIDKSSDEWLTLPIRFNYEPVKQWVPIGEGDARFTYVDLMPAPSGKHGQITTQYFLSGSFNFHIVAPSFSDYLADLVRNLENHLVTAMYRPNTQIGYWGYIESKLDFQAMGYSDESR